MIALKNRGTLNKLKDKLITALVLMFLTLATFTVQGQPPDPTEGDCNIPAGGGADEPCPLDTWVYVLVIAAIIYGVYKLQKKQQALST